MNARDQQVEVLIAAGKAAVQAGSDIWAVCAELALRLGVPEQQALEYLEE